MLFTGGRPAIQRATSCDGRRRRAVLEIREKSVWGRCEINAVLRERAARVPAPAWGPKPARSEETAA